MKKIILLLILTIIFNICCTKKENNSNINCETTIDLTQGFSKNNNVFLSDLNCSIEYIQIETNDSCLISKIKKIAFNDNRIFILSNNKIYIFNSQGKFLNTFFKQGKGPGEYLKIGDFVIDNNKKYIYILDAQQKKIFTYNYLGDFKYHFDLVFHPISIINRNKNEMALLYTIPDCYETGYSIGIHNKNLKLLKKLIFRERENPDNVDFINGRFSFNLIKNEIHFLEWGEEILYVIKDNNSIEKKYCFIYPNQRTLSSDININIRKKRNDITGVIETKDYIFIDGEGESELKKIIYYKLSNKSKCAKIHVPKISDGIINDLDGGWPFWPKGVINENVLYTYFFASRLKSIRENTEYTNVCKTNVINSDQLLSIINESRIMDNPIIMIVKFY